MPDLSTTATFLRLTDQIQREVPFARFELQYVAFSSAGVDAVINHHLDPLKANDVGYIVVQQSAAGSVFQDMSAARRLWTTDTIYLRSDTASLKVVLLIFTPSITMPTLVANL